MADALQRFLERKLLVVTGKGGAGKSQLSLALAHRLASQGRRVWLVEIGRKQDQSFTRLPDLLGKKSLAHEPTEVILPNTKQKIHASVLNPTQSLAEYVDLKLPTAGLAGMLLNNRVTSSFLEVVPGLPDLVSLGKLWHAATQPKEKFPVDTVILDAPASGHAVSLLRAPENFRRITRAGPIYRDAAAMEGFLADPAQTGILLTAIPEEMSVQETMELRVSLKQKFPEPLVVVNKCFPELPALSEEKDTLPWQCYRYARDRAERERETLRNFGKSTPVVLPFFFPEPKSPPLFFRLSEALA
jgi:anion-transporting  ArsA/GET3 family ATPase